VGDESISPGDAEELAAFFAAHAPHLFGYACVVAREDRAHAEDLVQGTFEAAGRAWRMLRPLTEEQRRSWLQATLGAIAMSGSRREGTPRSRLPRIEARYRKAQAEEPFPAAAVDRCWQVIRSLPERQHSVALLHWQQGMKDGEIAAALGMAEKTVGVDLRQVRRKLIAQLGPDHLFTGDDPREAPP
jgi:RNA polymerase sigma-70 factor, ECF subfamily